MYQIDSNSIVVDAACSGNPGVMEYRGLDMQTWKQIFHGGPFPLGTNNIGEFLAIIHGLVYVQKHPEITTIYSDSQTAISRIKKRKIKTTLTLNDKTAVLLERVQKAQDRLQLHRYTVQIVKRDTEKRGEIPADFGRK